MTHVSISAVAVAAMTGVLVMAWQAPAPQPAGMRMAQLSQNPDQNPGTGVNPVTPTPGAPSKTAIPEKMGEPVRRDAAPAAPSDNLGSQTPPQPRALDLNEPSPNSAAPSGSGTPPQR